jgi:hypothetical protein
MSKIVSVKGIVKPRHRVASGQSSNSPDDREIVRQLPFFQELELDLS